MRTPRPLVHPLTAILTLTMEAVVLSPLCLGTDDDTVQATSSRPRCVEAAHIAGLQVDEVGLCPPEAYLAPAPPDYVEGQVIVKPRIPSHAPTPKNRTFSFLAR